MRRILLDQGLAPHAAAILRQHGLDAVHVSEIGMARAEDIQILDRARNDESVCVTLDHDFHAHLAVTAGDPVPKRYASSRRRKMIGGVRKLK
jgi:predicted nuclease of predicted toxin-antitoxin system